MFLCIFLIAPKKLFLSVRILYSTKYWFFVKFSLQDLIVNQFLANVPILYSLKTPENFWFYGVFKGYKMGKLARNGLNKIMEKSVIYNRKKTLRAETNVNDTQRRVNES